MNVLAICLLSANLALVNIFNCRILTMSNLHQTCRMQWSHPPHMSHISCISYERERESVCVCVCVRVRVHAWGLFYGFSPQCLVPQLSKVTVSCSSAKRK